jgi:putative NADH-flavin reductase
LQYAAADLRDLEAVKQLMEGVDAVVSSIGTTAFPSSR